MATKYVEIMFAQGDDASELFDLLDSYGWDALINRLTDWDYGQATEDAAVVNGDIYDGLPKYRGEQRVSSGEYTVVADWPYNYVALYRELPADWQPTSSRQPTDYLPDRQGLGSCRNSTML